MNIIVFPGSFNPIHTGHAMLASYLAQFYSGADEVWLSVTPENPLKPLAGGASDANRVAMARLGVHGIPGVKVTDIEFSMPQPSYTHSLLCALAERWPEHHFTLLIGSDNWQIFDRWVNSELILWNFGVKIFQRPGYPVDAATLPKGAELLEGTPQIELSSTFVREALGEGKDMNYFLPMAVYKYVRDKSLYRKS